MVLNECLVKEHCFILVCFDKWKQWLPINGAYSICLSLPQTEKLLWSEKLMAVYQLTRSIMIVFSLANRSPLIFPFIFSLLFLSSTPSSNCSGAFYIYSLFGVKFEFCIHLTIIQHVKYVKIERENYNVSIIINWWPRLFYL